MSDRPPPFSALRAVEAASRHRSFTWAAKELQITHSAVSQSIRRLEVELGTTLFRRKGGAMEPSEAALKLAETYSEASLSLERTLREITGAGAQGVLTLAMPSDLGRLWFGGKLARLKETMPDLAIEIRTGGDGRNSHMAIRFAPLEDEAGQAMGPPLQAFPVCSPAFQATQGLLRPQQVLRAPLIAGGGQSWDQWASHFELAARPPAYSFDEAAMALDAAANGAGVALTDVYAAEGHLESGRLVALPLEAPTGRHMLLSVQDSPDRAEMAARFSMWLRLEVSRSLALHAARRPAGAPTL